MLGLCWTPATAHGVHKMASTMPSNPDQLLGAILVRKDIFHRFENTMHDTCLDANSLLEYLFSLYSSTVPPADRENLPSPQNLALMRRETDFKKSGQHVFPNPPPISNPQPLQPHIHSRSSDSRTQMPGTPDGQKKRAKVEQPVFQPVFNSVVHQHESFNQPAGVKPFENHSVFPGPGNHQISHVKMEVASGIELHRMPPASCLPPFSQICRQGNRPYSPASAQYSDSMAMTPHKDDHKNLGQDAGLSDAKTEIEGVLPGMSANQPAQKDCQNSSNHVKKQKNKGFNADGSNNTERASRKKKHPCFCGALFTRADNLKRHIRKCHEEKLEKLKGTSLEVEVNASDVTATENFSLVFPSAGQNVPEPSQATNSQSSQQQHQSQQYLPQDDNHQLLADNGDKSAPGVKWSCFCGESFDNHRQLVDHTRAHDSNR